MLAHCESKEMGGKYASAQRPLSIHVCRSDAVADRPANHRSRGTLCAKVNDYENHLRGRSPLRPLRPWAGGEGR